ncbi:CHAT domain-containing protein [Terrabacter sp. C0L_2]|uniref:CHAT domain-containing protein n=1 Tax=Terrabacter sp. C0L_2 TaxID=3108389 RepID=UPI002ED19BC4|nr:CHAT domain-containing protein [Terrabacter sp. C0L_2]
MSTLVGGTSPTQPEPYAVTPPEGAPVLPEQFLPEPTGQEDLPEPTGATGPDEHAALPGERGTEPVPPAPPAAAAPPPAAPPAASPVVTPPAPAPAAPVATPARTAPAAEEVDPDADPSRPLTRVRISHGDLRFARHHVLVGHYPGSTLVGGEGALDELLDGRLSRAALLGIYPGPIETCQVFTDPEQWTRPPGAVVAGLGPIGGLSAATLARAVAHASLTAALGHLTGGASATSTEVLQLRLSSLLIGTGQGGLPVRDSVQALLTGVQRANDRLADTELGVHIAELEVIELWQDRALQAVEALGSSLTSGELADSFTADLRLEERPGRQRRLLFSEPSGWWQQVRVRSEADGSLTFEASTRRAGTPTRTVPTQRALVDRLVESLVDSPSPDPSAARTLFELLFPNDLKAQAPDTDNLVLLVDRGSAHYPWELLDDQGTQEDREPLGVRRGLVRQLEGSSMRSHVLSATSSRALVVGDTASGLSALPAAQREARDVAEALRASGFDAEPLIAESGTKVVQALFASSYRVVHLAGHGVYEWPLGDGTDATVTGMVLGNGMYLTAGEVGQMRQVPELVVVNCCHLGSMGPVAPVGAVGTGAPGGPAGPGGVPGPGGTSGPAPRTGNYHRLAASFATELIDIGVRAVVACGWAVDDGAASTFATTLYDRMLSGLTFGEALGAARWQTWNDYPAVNTWGAYQCYGDPDYRLAPDAVVHRATTVRRAPASAEQARVEIENLSQSVDVSRNTRYGLDRLRELYEALTPEDREDDALQVLIARTYNKFGDFAHATQYFQQTLESGGTALTVRDFEVWIDQVVRAAATSEDAVDDAVATIESAIERLRALLDNPASLVLGAHAPERTAFLPGDTHPSPGGVGIDRLWRVASAYKRLALVTCPERPGGPHTGDWTQTHQALVAMSEWYAAARTASGATDRRRHGALANWLAAELALRWRAVEGRTALDRSEARDLIDDALKAAREEAYLAPTFWTVAVYADLLVLAALWSPRATADEAQQALDLYRRASELGSEEQLRQVRDQVDFLLVMAGTEAHRRVAFLRTLHDGLVALDTPTDGTTESADGEGAEVPGGTVTA